MVTYKDIARKQDCRKALEHHSPLIKDGKRDVELTNLF